MMDFTLKVYRELLVELKKRGYEFQTFRDFLKQPHSKVIMLRHDVDARNAHSLAFAEIQHEMGIKGTYYFRMVEGSFDRSIIRRMESLGHEIGYHYEAEVNTLCMHGSPQSKHDNKEIWKYYRYQDYGFVGEPYFDLNFNDVFYLTDTGMMWDGFKVSVRDKVNAQSHWPVYHSTFDILKALRTEKFPQQVMFNFHPQRWTDNKMLWMSEWIQQSVKNRVKHVFFVKK